MNERDKLNNEYFEYMYSMVINDRDVRDSSYRKLLYLLHDIEFTYTIQRDENRAADGVDFRYQFGLDRGYPNSYIKEHLDVRPCSVLEMMVALAYRIEDTIMDDYTYGNRTGQWFWNMLTSLGLGDMRDSHFDERHAEEIIFRFLDRRYSKNGHGGLFTLNHTKKDLRKVEIWYQAMWFLDENFDFSL